MNKFEDIVSFLPSMMVEDVLMEYDMNDPAHMRQHAFDVVCHADAIINKYPATLEPLRVPIIIGALVHDIKCHVNRDQHHVLGALAVEGILRDYDIDITSDDRVAEERDHMEPGEFITSVTYKEVEQIKFAVLEHRASWKHQREDVVSDVVAAADRGVPDMLKYIRRAVLFRTAHVDESSLPFTDEMKRNIIRESLEHMKEKYGKGGYVYKTLPVYTGLMYGDDLENIKDLLSHRTKELYDFAMDNFDKWVGSCQR